MFKIKSLNYTSRDKYKTALTISLIPVKSVYRNKTKQNTFKKYAFTLAEVLITLTIIGLVAAMTIPTLLTKYQKHTYVVGLKKAYSVLTNAITMIPIRENCSPGDLSCVYLDDYSDINIDGKNIKGEEKLIYFLSKNMKFAKICYQDEIDNCLKNYSKQYPSLAATGILEDGMIISSTSGYQLIVDVNGIKGPNQDGRDIFTFYFENGDSINYTNSSPNIIPGKIYPWGSDVRLADYHDEYWQNEPSKCLSGGQPTKSCTARVLEEDAMNY